jgi:hypothetical protein
MGFPRHHELNAIRRVGGNDVRLISKPFELHHLQHALQLGSAATA